MKKEIIFYVFGHKNIKGTHKNTIEFTKDDYLTPQGDCIIGVNSNFNFKQIKEILKWDNAEVIIEINDINNNILTEKIKGIVNKSFSSNHEIVLRRSDFISERTLLIRCDKSCVDLDRKFIDLLKNEEINLKITINKIN
jgi:uncharacterized protein